MSVRRCVIVVAASGVALGAGVLHAAEPPVPAVKPAIRGLVSMGAYRFVAQGGDPVNTLVPLDKKPGIFGGIVVVATWNELQPTADALDTGAIDRALADVRAYNARNPAKPLAVRLRVWGGFEAPLWAKRIGGRPIGVTHKNRKRQIGRFWSPAYRQAWARLQEKLAAKYDDAPLVREVAMTSCMSFTAEPFFLPADDPGEIISMPIHDAGYTDDAYKTCLGESLADYAAWQRTRIVLSVNPFRGQDGKADAGFTETVMRAYRKALGVRCVFDNHDLDSDLGRALVPLYALMKELGPEIVFQTFHETPLDFDATIQLAVDNRATAVELWQDYKGFPLVPIPQLKKWAALVESNQTP